MFIIERRYLREKNNLSYRTCTSLIPAETPPKVPEETPAETPAETLPYEEDGIFVTTSDAMDYEIQNALYKKHPGAHKSPGDFNISYFYGEFNGAYVIHVGGMVGTAAIEYDYFGEYVFIYSGGDAKLHVYNSKDGEFYILKKAYDAGLLTIEDIGVIYEQFVKLNPNMYDFDENGGVIPPKKPVVEIIDGYFYIDGVYTGIKAPSATN